MGGRAQPEHGADSACPICQGAGFRMGGDEYQTCPKCKGGGCDEAFCQRRKGHTGMHSTECDGFHGDNAWGQCLRCGERLEAHQMIAP